MNKNFDYSPLVDFYTARIQGTNTFKIQCGELSCFIKRGRKLSSVKRNLFTKGNICESKTRNNKIL